MPKDAAEFVAPSAIPIECKLLGSIIIDPKRISEVRLIVEPKDFYRPANQTIYKAMLDLWDAGSGIDSLLVIDYLTTRGTLESCGGIESISGLTEEVPSAANAEHYAKIVKRKSQLRAFYLAIYSAGKDDTVDTEEINERIAELRKSLDEIEESSEVEFGGRAESLISQAFDEYQKKTAPGIPTGLLYLDTMIGGLHPGLTLLAARPSVGKTSLASRIAEHVALDLRRPVLFVTLEVDPISFTTAMLCSRAQVVYDSWRNRKLSEIDFANIAHVSPAFKDAPLTVVAPAIPTASNVSACIRRHHELSPLALVVVDYLQIMEAGNRRENRQQDVSEMSRTMKRLSTRLRIPILALCQLNRECDAREDKRPKMSDLRESGSLEQDADVVMMLYRADYYEPQSPDKGTAELIIAKNRHGRVGMVRLAWREEFARFDTLSSGPEKSGFERGAQND